MVCGVSCSKDNPERQFCDVTEQIAAAVDAATLPVCDKNGDHAGDVIFIKGTRQSSLYGAVVLDNDSQIDLDEQIVVTSAAGNPIIPIELEEDAMVAKGVAICSILTEAADQLMKHVTPLNAANGEIADKIGKGQEFFVKLGGREQAEMILPRAEVEANPENYIGMNFLVLLVDRDCREMLIIS